MAPPPSPAGPPTEAPVADPELICEVCGRGGAYEVKQFGTACVRCLAEAIDNPDREFDVAPLKALVDMYEQDLRLGRLQASQNGNGLGPAERSRFHDGSIILDAPEHVPAVWGRGHEVLWAEGEPLIVAGPPGVGKTTLAQQITLARCGVGPQDVLGHPVAPSARRTLYVAADRPQQALRSMRRMVGPGDRDRLVESLVVRKGPFDVLTDREHLLAELEENGIGTVMLDSIKDVAGDVTDGKVGSEFNQTLQLLVASGIEVVALHHPRKAQQGNKKPKRLDDLYGSQWIAAGAGSVVCLWGEAGEAEVELLHLKQPDNVVGPLIVAHDHTTGTSTIKPFDALEQREEVRLACIEALTEKAPLGREALKKAIRARGIRCTNEKLHPILDSIADEEGSGVDRNAKGFVLEGCPE